MAVFTAIASAITGAILSAGLAATTIFGTLTVGGLVTSVIAGGLAMGTAKVLGVFKPPNVASAKDPGVKVQVAPSTDNKVPVFYGKNLTGGLIVDAGISNQNDTMTYVIVLGEKTDSGTYFLGDQYRGDQKLNFGVGASSHIVTSVTDANGTSANKVNGKMRVRAYAGGTASTNQIFPTTNKVAATTMLSTINASTSYEGLVYVVFQIDYDAEEGLTGLGQYTTEITNSLSEPGAVLSDFLLNSRYGAGLTTAEVDTASIAELTTYATEQVEYQNSVGTTLSHNRWAINGMLGTYSDVFTNIDMICQACSTFFTYNPKIGKFEVVPNREATTAEKSAAYVLDDDNVIGAIDVTSTELYAQYNAIEAEFPDGAERDQTSTVFISTPSGELNPNEPTNKLVTRYPICNDVPRVTNLAQIDLRQSRKDLVVQLDADYAAIQSDVGDIIKLTNATYGFTDKLFRVMRVSEQEAEDGMLSVKMVLLEYDDDIYTHIVAQDSGALDLTGIPGWWTGIWGNVDWSNISNIIGNITIVDDPLSNVANIVDPPTGNITSNVDIGNVIYGPGAGGPDIPSINFPITIPPIPDIDKIIANINIMGGSTSIEPEMATIFPTTGATFTPGETVNVSLPQPKPVPKDPAFPAGPLTDELLAELRLEFGGTFDNRSIVANTANIALNNRGAISRADLGNVQAGLQYEEDVSNNSVANAAVVSAPIGSNASIVAPIDIVDLGAIDYGEFSAVNSVVPYGALNGLNTNEIAYKPAREIYYKEFDVDPSTGKYTANANADIGEIAQGSGIISGNLPTIPTLTDNFKYEISETRGSSIAVNDYGRPPASATKAYVPNYMNVINYANSDLNVNPSGVRGFDVTNLDKRISKSDVYIDIGGFF